MNLKMVDDLSPNNRIAGKWAIHLNDFNQLIGRIGYDTVAIEVSDGFSQRRRQSVISPTEFPGTTIAVIQSWGNIDCGYL